MITTVTNDYCVEFRGLSTDTKPIGVNCTNSNMTNGMIIGNGSVFFEIDTGKVYMLKIVKTTSEGVTTTTGTWVEI